ncbi:MAG: hypothetical protein HY399_05615 [Elusimicrobia bacterium]|nr:hypothetical protein [Elusimicrobiota bacterium]
MEFLGYRFDEKTGIILSPTNQPTSRSEISSLLQPFTSIEEVKPESRTGLITVGYRIDYQTGHILDPKTKKPINRLEATALLYSFALGNKHLILERAHHLSSSYPDSSSVSDMVRELLSREKGVMPQELMSVADTAKTNSANLRQQVEQAYIHSTQFWDGQSFSDGIKKSNLLTRSSPPTAPHPRSYPKIPIYFDETEKKVGKVLSQDITTRLSLNPVGRELLSKFKDRFGRIKLPGVLVTWIDPRAGAIYNSQSKSLIVNQQYILDGLLSDFPEKDRDKMGQQLGDPKKLADYLLKNPKARARFVTQNDVPILHELTHAWQDKRGHLFLEMNRGHLPGVDPLESEYEAFLNQSRYIHYQLMKDAESVAWNRYLSTYLSFMVDFDLGTESIHQTYSRDWPEGAATFATTDSLQTERLGVTRRLMEDPNQRVIQQIKIRGMKHGTRVLQEEKSDYKRRMDQFLKTEYPQLRQEAYAQIPKLSSIYINKGRLDYTFSLLRLQLLLAKAIKPQDVSRIEKDLGTNALIVTDWLPRDSSLTLEDKLGSLHNLLDYYDQKKEPRPKALQDLRFSLCTQAANTYLDSAHRETDPKNRSVYMDAAEFYAKEINDTKLLEAIQKERTAK